MKVWGRIRKDNRTAAEMVVAIEAVRKADVEDWSEPIGEVCKALDLARPVILKKHLDEIERFSNTAFRQQDFMEPIAFDKLEIEIF